MQGTKQGTLRLHKLSDSDKRLWAKFMTPEYVVVKDNVEYVIMKFEGHDHMEQIWRITKVDNKTRGNDA